LSDPSWELCGDVMCNKEIHEIWYQLRLYDLGMIEALWRKESISLWDLCGIVSVLLVLLLLTTMIMSTETLDHGILREVTRAGSFKCIKTRPCRRHMHVYRRHRHAEQSNGKVPRKCTNHAAPPAISNFLPLTLFHSNKKEARNAKPAHAIDKMNALVTAMSYAVSTPAS